MIAARRPDRRSTRLLHLDARRGLHHRTAPDLARQFRRGDVVVINDAATLPASLRGTHRRTGAPLEIRLAGWIRSGDPSRFLAVAFGDGDHRTPTEHRPAPPELRRGDLLQLGPLRATVLRRVDHDRLIAVRFHGTRDTILAGIARHGRVIQYAHVPQDLDLWDMWTSVASVPLAFEPPSAGFALDWSTLAAWERRGIQVATLTHAAGVSSTGDDALDRHLPLNEPYTIPPRTAALVNRARATGHRVIAIGTTVVRALESAAAENGTVAAGTGCAHLLIGPETELRTVNVILSGVHEPGESHFELLRAFARDLDLARLGAEADAAGYRTHEFGDVVLVERAEPAAADLPAAAGVSPTGGRTNKEAPVQ